MDSENDFITFSVAGPFFNWFVFGAYFPKAWGLHTEAESELFGRCSLYLTRGALFRLTAGSAMAPFLLGEDPCLADFQLFHTLEVSRTFSGLFDMPMIDLVAGDETLQRFHAAMTRRPSTGKILGAQAAGDFGCVVAASAGRHAVRVASGNATGPSGGPGRTAPQGQSARVRMAIRRNGSTPSPAVGSLRRRTIRSARPAAGPCRDTLRSAMDAAGERDSVRATRDSYERIPYETKAWSSAQPASIEVVARLYGIEAAPADSCRVLEIGCGDGGNLVPLAIAHPKSEFLGVDLAPIHVERANRRVKELNLGNVRFLAGSFERLGEEFGAFDYVIGHGILSWIAPELQEELFATCRRRLAPRGVAFLSYNTYPGWFMQHAIREMLREHCRDVPGLQTRVARSRELLEVLVQTVPERENAFRSYLESVASVAANPAHNAYFAHEYLEEENHPFYLRHFVRRAANHGLRYFADADRVDSELGNMPDQPRGLLEKLASDRIERLQVLDYAVNRKFRQGLLCRNEVPARDEPDLRLATEMFVGSALSLEGEERSLEPGVVVCFGERSGRTVEVDQPLVKAALLHFEDVSRQPIAFEELVARAEGTLARPSTADEREVLALVLGRMFVAGVLELRRSPPCWATAVPELPIASPLVRLDAAEGRNTTSLRHRSLRLDNDTVREVLMRLDGSRSADDLAREVPGGLPRREIDEILRLAAANAVLMP